MTPNIESPVKVAAAEARSVARMRRRRVLATLEPGAFQRRMVMIRLVSRASGAPMQVRMARLTYHAMMSQRVRVRSRLVMVRFFWAVSRHGGHR